MIDREVKEAKTIASKTLTQAVELGDQVRNLQDRVTRIEGWSNASSGSWEGEGMEDPRSKFRSAKDAYGPWGGSGGAGTGSASGQRS